MLWLAALNYVAPNTCVVLRSNAGRLQTLVLLPQGFASFDELGVDWDAGYGADLHTLGLVKVAHTFSAFMRVDLVDLFAQVNSLVRAFGLAHIAVDAFVSD
jgi:hypothetical protein